MHTLLENDLVKISIQANDKGKHAILCFTGIGLGLGGIEVQREEFLRASDSSTLIFIIDKTRSWGNNIDFAEIRNIVELHAAGKTIHSLGNSMGGFLAVLASKFVTIANAIAFVPQYSVHPLIAPRELRWRQYVEKIKEWHHASLSQSFVSNTQYYIISGDDGPDGAQVSMFPNADNVHKILFNNTGIEHNIADVLKREGLLYDVIYDCISGNSVEDILNLRFSNGKLGAYSTTV